MALAGVTACTLLVDTSDLAGTAAGDGGPETAPAGEGGSSDAGAGDAPRDGGLPCPPFALFCNDFESGDLTKWAAVDVPNGGITRVDGTAARRGSLSLYAKVSASVTAAGGGSVKSGARARASIGSPKKSGLLVVRSWVYLPAALEGETTLIAAGGSSDINLKVRATGVLVVDSDTPGVGVDKLGFQPMPVWQWVCVEWRVAIGNPGHVTVLLDGATTVDAD